MIVNFRQGLIAFQKEAAVPQYLKEASANSLYVSHVISPTSTQITLAHGSSDYFLTFDTTIDLAWGPMVAGVDNYLYWDIDLLTSEVTRGITTLVPVTSLTAPANPSHDQHWFDMSTTTMKVWDNTQSKWRPRVRLFAGRVVQGNTDSIIMYAEGSQVNLNVQSNPGYIVLDTLLNPIRKSNGEFLTDNDKARVRSTVGTGGVLVQPINKVISVRAGEPLPRMSLVYFSGPDTVRLASSNPAFVPMRVPVGVIMDPVAAGDIGTLVTSGELSYDGWNWSGSEGLAIYSDSTGQISTTRPSGLMAYRVGFIKNRNTIILNIDAETFPQVYTAPAASFLINGIAPIQVADTINGLGERVITVSGSDATASARGFMSAASFNMLQNHEARLTVAEGDIVTLRNTKANLVHTHAISDVINLQSTIDVINAAIAMKITKVNPATVGDFPALTADGSLVDSGFSPSSFALVNHTHTIPSIIGLQAALNEKVSKLGDTMAGALYLASDPTSPTMAATKAYVDARTQSNATVIQPVNQIVYGTGVGISSAPDFTYDNPSGSLFFSHSSATPGNILLFATRPTGAAVDGGSIVMSGADGATGAQPGSGGSVTISAGTSNRTTGGAVSITAGDANHSGVGGSATLAAGGMSGTGASAQGGDALVKAGSINAAQGNAFITGTAGNATLEAGHVQNQGNFTGVTKAGDVNLIAGQASDSSTAGDVVLNLNNGTHFYKFKATGGLEIDGDEGQNKYVLTSRGAGSSPSWQPLPNTDTVQVIGWRADLQFVDAVDIPPAVDADSYGLALPVSTLQYTDPYSQLPGVTLTYTLADAYLPSGETRLDFNDPGEYLINISCRLVVAPNSVDPSDSQINGVVRFHSISDVNDLVEMPHNVLFCHDVVADPFMPATLRTNLLADTLTMPWPGFSTSACVRTRDVNISVQLSVGYNKVVRLMVANMTESASGAGQVDLQSCLVRVTKLKSTGYTQPI